MAALRLLTGHWRMGCWKAWPGMACTRNMGHGSALCNIMSDASAPSV
jgi:hypothetical protein